MLFILKHNYSNTICRFGIECVGGNRLNIRKWVGLFFKTLFLGGAVGLVASFFVVSQGYIEVLKPFDFINLLGLVIWYILYGFLFSIISQAGFFAYLFVNQFGLGLFRSFWSTVQLVLIAFVLFDLVYFPYTGMDGEIQLYLFILMAIAILIYGLIVAKIKARQTHPRAFMPTLFLMVVMTAIEWVPGLRTGEVDYAALMIFTLLACNTYQILILHHLTKGAQTQKTIHNQGKAKGQAAGAKKQSQPAQAKKKK